jgi:hypothetical protein
MKTRFLGIMLFLVGTLATAQVDEGPYNTARLLIYGENPVMTIPYVSDDAMRPLISYSMKGTDPKTVKQLNDDDAWLLSFLCFADNNRRNAKTNSEFLVYLQERTEWLNTQPKNGKTGRALGWVMVYEGAIRGGTLSIGRIAD